MLRILNLTHDRSCVGDFQECIWLANTRDTVNHLQDEAKNDVKVGDEKIKSSQIKQPARWRYIVMTGERIPADQFKCFSGVRHEIVMQNEKIMKLFFNIFSWRFFAWA